MRAVLAIDQGTTGTTALLVGPDQRILASHNVEFPNHYPSPGLVEHDVAQIATSVEQAVAGAFAASGLTGRDVVAVGITNQRETCLFWDGATGRPLQRALVWQDRRTADACAALRDQGLETLVRDRTGLVLDPYFSGTKAKWMLDAHPGARSRAAAGALRFGTIDTWLAWTLTGEHVTDASNASRTLFYDLHTRDWSDALLALLDVPKPCLPRIVDSSGVFGHTKGVGWLPDGIPVAGLIGDQQGALFGQACFAVGEAKCTYGTGAFILLNTGDTPKASRHGLLTTVAWQRAGRTTYALEGSAFVAGAAVQWLRDGLGIVRTAAEIEPLAASVPDSAGVTFVPALTGLGAPHWRPDARGIVTGLTRGTTAAHLARAALDGIALQIDDILGAMTADLGQPLTRLRVDGGAARNNLLMQRQADLLGVGIDRPVSVETTGLGSALLAGLAVGFFPSMDALRAGHDRSFEPAGDASEMAATRARWQDAVAKA